MQESLTPALFLLNMILGEKMHDAKGESYACCNH